jgi:hypothetical protein
LLIAMIGSIALTLKKKFLVRSQKVFSQVLRDFNVAIIHYD